MKTELQLARRSVKTEAIVTIGIAALASIEVELDRLKSLFSSAKFILSEKDVQVLSQLCSIHINIKLDVANHLKKLKSISIGTRIPIANGQNNLNSVLETEILRLKIMLEKFNDKLFKKPTVNRHML